MATILAHIQVKPGREPQFEAIARRLYEATHLTETGVRRYEFWRAAEPGRYYCPLSFDDFRAFIAHQASDHHERESPEIRQCLESIHLEWVDPVAGASDLVATGHQAAADDADELTARYTEVFAAKVAEWWSVLR